jgi:hypothetical protein
MLTIQRFWRSQLKKQNTTRQIFQRFANLIGKSSVRLRSMPFAEVQSLLQQTDSCDIARDFMRRISIKELQKQRKRLADHPIITVKILEAFKIAYFLHDCFEDGDGTSEKVQCSMPFALSISDLEQKVYRSALSFVKYLENLIVYERGTADFKGLMTSFVRDFNECKKNDESMIVGRLKGNIISYYQVIGRKL